MGSVAIALAYFLITLLCVGISAYSTFHGLEDYLRNLALSVPFATVVTAGLFACDLALLDRRRKGVGIFGIVAVLLLFTAVSWAFNFHFFYKQLVATELAKERFEKATLVFDSGLAAAETRLLSEQSLPQVRRELDQAFKNLRAQVADRQNPGLGSTARTHVDEIHKTVERIPGKITSLKLPDPKAAATVVESYIADLSNLAYGELERAEKASPWQRGLGELRRLKSGKEEVKAQLPSQGAASAHYVKAIQQVAGLTREAERQLKQIFEEHAARTGKQLQPLPRLEVVTPSGIEMTDMPASVQLGLASFATNPKDWPKIAKTVAAGLFAVFVDLMPLIFALLLIHPARSIARHSSGERTAHEDTPAAVISNLLDAPSTESSKRPPLLRKAKG